MPTLWVMDNVHSAYSYQHLLMKTGAKCVE